MTRRNKLREKVLRGTSDTDVPFSGLCYLLKSFGFSERIRGSHHVFFKEGIEDILNLQPQNSQAKPYQVKQVRNLILKHNLGG